MRLTVPGGPNRPNRGAIPPVPPGPLHAPNLTPPTIEGLTVQVFQEVRAAPTPAHSPWSRTPPSAPGARHAGVPPMRVRTHVAMRAQALRTFFELLSQAKATQTAPPQLPFAGCPGNCSKGFYGTGRTAECSGSCWPGHQVSQSGSKLVSSKSVSW